MREAPDPREIDCESPDLCDGKCDLHEAPVTRDAAHADG